MNTEEDEFKRIEAEAKRRAQAAEDDDTQGYVSEFELAVAQQAGPPPEWLLVKNILAEYGLDAISFVAEWKAAQRQWVGLEAEDLAQIESDEFWQVGNHMAIAMAVEAALKERNT